MISTLSDAVSQRPERLTATRAVRGVAVGLLRLLVAASLTQSVLGVSSLDEKFDVLRIGTGSYTNVTVIKKLSSFIIILHTHGSASVKISDLAPDIRQQLGYATDEEKKAGAGSASGSAKQMLASIGLPEAKQFGQMWHIHSPAGLTKIASDPVLAWTVLGLALGAYLFFSYCCMLICRKAHTEPGAMVWVPLFQLFPLLRAAGMSGAWFLAFLLPVFNILAQIVWYVNIVKARGKSLWVTLWLLLPVTGPFAFAYLAFSSATPIKVEREPELMVLDAG